jgi:hypothetical protein
MVNSFTTHFGFSHRLAQSKDIKWLGHGSK